jgi:Undecaprenyl-phosphate glucose phosphotransferase
MILRLKFYRLCLKIVIYLLPILAFRLGWWLWAFLCMLVDRPVNYSRELFSSGAGHFTPVLLSTLVWAFVAEHYKVTSFDELFRERTGVRAAWSACLATSFVLLATLYLSRNEVFPRGLVVSAVAILLLLTILIHAAFRVLCRKGLDGVKPTRLLIIGADEFAREVAQRLKRISFSPCEIVGYVRLPDQEVSGQNERIYEFAQLNVLDSRHGIDETIIAIHPAQFSQIPTIIKALGHLCLPAHAVVDLGEGIVVRERLFQLGNIQMLDLTATPTDYLDYVLVKRVFDICFSVLVLLLTFPLIALIALLIRLTSVGPAFFSQERIGLNGKPFKMYKFRTMRVSPASVSDTKWTMPGDPRTTRLGALLRKTSLDELPQFVNVLKGNMSVVGPRPERPHFVNSFLQEISRYNNRHALKVGITGWAQVNGWRGDTSIEKRIEYDLYYLQNWSFTFDLRIIFMTILSGLINKSAY